jgi:hypothetical protein
MKLISTTVGVAAALFTAGSAMAGPVVSLIDFDHVTHAFAAPLSFYDQLHWLNFGVLAGAHASPVGLFNSVVSTDYVAYNPDFTTYSAFYGPSFTLQDAYFGAAARDGLQLDVVGVDRHFNLIDSTSFTVDTLGPTFETFNWTNLYAVFIFASGGTVDAAIDPGQDSTIFALDNLRISNVVPEPGTLLLAGLGFGALAFRRRRAA